MQRDEVEPSVKGCMKIWFASGLVKLGSPKVVSAMSSFSKQSIISVGIDIGTTTTQLVISRLTIKNIAPGSAVPRMECFFLNCMDSSFNSCSYFRRIWSS